MRYIIIGASIAGTTAAETLRRLDPTCDIHLFTKENYPLYSRITVASYASGIAQKENLILRKIEHFHDKNINFHPGTEVNSIDIKRHTITTKDEIFTYDKLLITTGGHPKSLNVPGSNAIGVFTMHTLDDGTDIQNYSKSKKKAVVAGGAFIGIDFVNTFISHNLGVTFLIKGPYFLHSILDEDAANIIHTTLEAKGVNIRVNEHIQEIVKNDNGEIEKIITNTGEIECDILGVGIGIERINHLIETSGIAYHNGIVTNEYLQTSDPDVYAAGDSAEYFNILEEKYSICGDWLSARNQGECAAKNMIGDQVAYDHISINTINLFGINVSIIGNSTPANSKFFKKYEGKMYKKIFTVDDIIIGGIVIGDTEYAAKIKAAISNKMKPSSIDI